MAMAHVALDNVSAGKLSLPEIDEIKTVAGVFKSPT